MKIIKFFLLYLPFLICLVPSNAKPEILDCTKGQDDSDLITLKQTDAILVISVEPITASMNLFVILTYVLSKDMRSNPADLIVAIAFMDLFQGIILLSNSIYYFSEDQPVLNNCPFCLVTGFIQILCTYNEIFYNTSFALFLVLKVKYLFKPISIPNSLFHIVIILIDVFLCFEIFYFTKIGKTITGICGLDACSLETSFQHGTKFFVFLVINVFSLWYFKKKIPMQDLEVMKLKSNFLDYYYLYIKISLFGYTLSFIVGSILLMNSYYWGNRSIAHFTTVDNIIRLFMTMSLSFIRLRDPFIKNKIDNVINKFFKKTKSDGFLETIDQNSKNISEVESISYYKKTIIYKADNEIEIGGDRRKTKIEDRNDHPSAKTIKNTESNMNSSLNIELMSPEKLNINSICPSIMEKKISVFEVENPHKLNLMNRKDIDGNSWLDLLGQNIRMNFTVSILTGILVSHHRFQKKKKPKGDYDTLRNNSLFFREKMKLKIKEKYLTGQNQEGEKNLLMTVHAGHMFNDILEKDKDIIDIEASLNIAKNHNNIDNMNKSEGGKSGEFFFSTFDNKLLIKTINKKELDIFIQHFMEYYNYFLKINPKSLITPIYGIFSFERVDIAQMAHIILMRNITNTPKENIHSIYDLKGSSYDREVLKKQKNLDKIKVLKDLDFVKIEGKLYLELTKEIIQDILVQDANFLKGCGFIDYSLLVIKCLDKSNNDFDFDKGFSDPEKDLHILKSSKDKDFSYHIGIIDYFQKYNLQKRLEKYGKKMINMDPNLDTSSQDPDVYASRFINFIDSILSNEI